MIERIDLLLAARGNHFMLEIAELYQAGFRQLGMPCRIALDEYPNKEDSPAIYPLIVAPHEYFALYADQAHGRSRRKELAARAGMLNTEQPGSPWFDFAWAVARHARTVFDLNQDGVAAFGRLGVPAIHAPLGYAPPLEDVGEAHDGSKPIDIVFLGHSAPKRDRFFAHHREMFQKYECRLLFAPVNRPRSSDTPGCVFGADRNRLLRSAKVLINLHSTDRRYFEWHRALCAIANHCLLVTETSDGMAPLVSGEHIIAADADQLAQLCVYYAQHDNARKAMTDRAYRLLSNELSIQNACRSILDAAQSGSAGRPLSHGAGRVREYQKRITLICRGLSHLLCYNPITYPAHAAWLRLCFKYQQWFGVKEYAARRRGILQRLAAVEQTGPRADYSLTDNPAHATAGAPALSVIVTLYNYAHYVRACLDSVVASETSRLPGAVELVVVDDASTDGGADVVADFMTRCPLPVRLVRKASNTGLADARNLGVRQARADHVFILDADNLIYPRCLERLYQTLRSGKLAAAFGVIACFDDRTGAGVGLHSAFDWDVPRLVHGAYIDAMAMFDRARMLSVGGYSTELIRYGWFGWEDYDLWLKLASAGHECRLCPQIVAAYRVHGASMIRVTNAYAPNLIGYFNQKFAPLLERLEPLNWAFGWRRSPRRGRRLEQLQEVQAAPPFEDRASQEAARPNG